MLDATRPYQEFHARNFVRLRWREWRDTCPLHGMPHDISGLWRPKVCLMHGILVPSSFIAQNFYCEKLHETPVVSRKNQPRKSSFSQNPINLSSAQDRRGTVCHAAARGNSRFTERLFLSTAATDDFKVSGHAETERDGRCD